MNSLRKGDETAFVKIYDAYWKRLFTLAYQRVCSKSVAEELTQNLFLVLWEKRQQLLVDDLESYLLKSIKNSVIDYIRKEVQSDKYARHYELFRRRTFDSISEEVKFADLEEAINKGLSQLPLKTQAVFRLNRLENWPLGKISTHLNLSEKTVGYHLTKSLKFMRGYLREFIFILLILAL